MTDFVASVDRGCAELFSRGERILVAVSGGVDSMVLLHVLKSLAAQHRWELTVAHLNHQLRGADADGDEAFVANAARKLDLPIVIERTDVRGRAKAEKCSIEMAARWARHRFLAHAAKERDIQSVALAHHADDRVELFFMRLFRGAGSDGLSAMKPMSLSPMDGSIRLARPLLSATREQIVEYAKAEGIAFHEDLTNASVDIVRNRIRHKLLPLIARSYQPAIRDVILRTIDLLEAEAEFVNRAATEWLMTGKPAFDRLSVAVQRRALRLQLIREGIPLDFNFVERLRSRAGEPVTVWPGTTVSRDARGRLYGISNTIHFEFAGDSTADAAEIDLGVNRGKVQFSEVEIHWHIVSVSKPPARAKRE